MTPDRLFCTADITPDSPQRTGWFPFDLLRSGWQVTDCRRRNWWCGCWWMVSLLNAFPIKATALSIVFACLYDSHGHGVNSNQVSMLRDLATSLSFLSFRGTVLPPVAAGLPVLRSAKLLDCDTFYCAVTVAQHALFVQFQGLGSMRLASKWAFQFSTQSPVSGNVSLSNKCANSTSTRNVWALLQGLVVPHGEFQTCMPVLVTPPWGFWGVTQSSDSSFQSPPSASQAAGPKSTCPQELEIVGTAQAPESLRANL